MGRIAKLLFAGLILTVASACTSSRTYGEAPSIRLLPASELPAPFGPSGGAETFDSRIGAFDTITVDVMGIEGLSDRRFMVDGNGKINLPIAGNVQVGGLTTGEAVDSITEKLRANFVRQPQVAVNLYESSSNYVSVQGSVTMPGNYPVLQGMTLTRAIASSRGFSDTAMSRKVVILRSVDGVDYVALYDVEEIQRANYPDPKVYKNDTIVVGESASKRLLQQVLQAAPLLVGPIVAILQNN